MANKTTDRLRHGIGILQKIEDSVLIGLLLLMIGLAVFQIILRNLFDSGMTFGDELIRILVLWISLVGAMVASRNNSHINIDLVSRYLPDSVKRLSTVLVGIFTSFICAVTAYFSLNFVLMEKSEGIIAFSGIPAWACESVIPLAFAVISFRYLLLSLATIFNPPAQKAP
jgi:TRAP-type C4-dicarboxylate transport system permease small subunit